MGLVLPEEKNQSLMGRLQEKKKLQYLKEFQIQQAAGRIISLTHIYFIHFDHLGDGVSCVGNS